MIFITDTGDGFSEEILSRTTEGGILQRDKEQELYHKQYKTVSNTILEKNAESGFITALREVRL